MNIEIANRLVQMRKEKGLSQEALAEKLGLSRQSVSKWERAESSPDTSNLISLAKLYNISLDELLNTDQEKFESAEPLNVTDDNKTVDSTRMEEKINTFVNVGFDGVHVKDGDTEVNVGWKGVKVTENGTETVNIGRNGAHHWKYRRTWTADGLIILLVVAAYLFLGAVYSMWHPGWLVFLLIPILTSLIMAIRKRNARDFSFSVLVFGGILTAIIVYGMPWTTWLALIIIPIYYEIVKIFGGEKGKLVHTEATLDSDGNIISERVTKQFTKKVNDKINEKLYNDPENIDVDVQVNYSGKEENPKKYFHASASRDDDGKPVIDIDASFLKKSEDK